MRIRLLAVGTRMAAWVTAGFDEYVKRLPGELSLELVELNLGHRGKNADTARAIAREGDDMIAAIGKGDRVVALDVKGKPWSTEQLATELEGWQMDGRNISLLIGGPDGLDSRALALADQRWSLSPLTLPHPLVRVVLAEQLYRAWSVTRNHPYHRA